MDKAAAAVWADPDTFATCLVALGLDRYGPGTDGTGSPLHWAPGTWTEEVKQDTGVDLPQRNLDRLMGACALMTRPDEFRRSAAAFSTVASALAGVWFEPDVWHPPTVDEVLWALVEAHMLDPEATEAFGPEVVRYVNMIVRNEGFRALPHAFPTFGVPVDPGVWERHSAVDYSAEPNLNAAVEDATRMRESDLDLDTADRVADLAARIAALPVRNDAKPVAAELAAYAAKLRVAGMDAGADDAT